MVFDLTTREFPKDVDIIITNLLVPALKPDTNFVHEEIDGSTEVSIEHNLGKLPSVTIIDKSGNMVSANINYVDNNNITCTFEETFTGKIILN